MTAPTAQQQGRAAQRSGAAMQQDVHRANQWYRSHGLGVVTDIHPATVLVKGERQLVKSEGPPDYVGFLLLGGVPTPLAFDAKRTSSEHFPLSGFMGNAATRGKLAKQVDFLLDFERAGGCAGFLCLDEDVGQMFWLSATFLQPLVSVAFLAGWEKPSLLIRSLAGKDPLVTPHRHVAVSTDRAVVSHQRPRLDYRALFDRP